MELIDYVRMLGRRWRWWVSLLLLGAIAGAGIAASASTSYRSTSEVYIAARSAGVDITDPGAQRDQVGRILDSMPSYVALIDANDVLAGVLNDVPSNLTEGELSGKLSAVAVPKSVIIRITASASTGKTAKALADAAAKRLGGAIENLGVQSPGAASTVSVAVIRQGKLPSQPTSRRTITLALGILLGLGLGLIAASLRDAAVRSSEQGGAGAAPLPPLRPTAPSGPRIVPAPVLPFTPEPEPETGFDSEFEPEFVDEPPYIPEEPAQEPPASSYVAEPAVEAGADEVDEPDEDLHRTHRPNVDLSPATAPAPVNRLAGTALDAPLEDLEPQPPQP